MKPVTSLPWTLCITAHTAQIVPKDDSQGRFILAGNRHREGMDDDVDFAIHAANAYPKLVERLREVIDAENSKSGGRQMRSLMAISELLRELGEAA